MNDSIDFVAWLTLFRYRREPPNEINRKSLQSHLLGSIGITLGSLSVEPRWSAIWKQVFSPGHEHLRGLGAPMKNGLNGSTLFRACRVDATSAWDTEPDAGCRRRSENVKDFRASLAFLNHAYAGGFSPLATAGRNLPADESRSGATSQRPTEKGSRIPTRFFGKPEMPLD